jgi:hypothetical protein
MTHFQSWPLPIAVVIAALTLPAIADGSKWPSGVLADDTFLIATLNLDAAKPADLLALFKTATGGQLGDLKEVAEKYEPLFGRYAGAGLASVSLIYRGDPDKPDEPSAQWCLRVAPGANHPAVTDQLKADFAESLGAWDIVNDGDFVLVRPKGAAKAAEAGAARKALWDDAASNAKSSLCVICVPTAAVQELAAKPKRAGEIEMFPAIDEITRLFFPAARWIRLNLNINTPSGFEAAIQCQDAPATIRVDAALKKSAKLVKDQIGALRQSGSLFGNLADGTDAMADDMTKAVTDGSRVAFRAKGKSLAAAVVLFDFAMDPVAKSLPISPKP